jgi:hypothetical protein
VQQLSPLAPQSERPGPLAEQLGAVVPDPVEPPVPDAPPVAAPPALLPPDGVVLLPPDELVPPAPASPDERLLPQATDNQAIARYKGSVVRVFIVLLNRH